MARDIQYSIHRFPLCDTLYLHKCASHVNVDRMVFSSLDPLVLTHVRLLMLLLLSLLLMWMASGVVNLPHPVNTVNCKCWKQS